MRKLLSGNEAIARGAYEAGVKVAKRAFIWAVPRLDG